MQGGGQRLALLPDRTLMLLSEITASTSRRDGSESDDAALIRLMADPLLLRDHLVESSGTDSGGLGPFIAWVKGCCPRFLFRAERPL